MTLWEGMLVTIEKEFSQLNKENFPNFILKNLKRAKPKLKPTRVPKNDSVFPQKVRQCIVAVVLATWHKPFPTSEEEIFVERLQSTPAWSPQSMQL